MLSNIQTCRLGIIDYSQIDKYFLSVLLGYYLQGHCTRDTREKKR